MASTAAAAGAPQGPGVLRPWTRMSAYAAVAAISIASYISAHLAPAGMSTAFSILGVGACGWAWLAARAVFAPAAPDARWPLAVGLLVAVSGAVDVLAPAGGLADRLAGNIYSLSGSAALLLTFVEPIASYRRDLPAVERRFRLAFVVVYALLVAIAVLGLRTVGDGPEAALRDATIKALCAVVGLGGLVASMWFRAGHPWPSRAAGPVPRAATADDVRIGERLMRLVRDREIDLQPELKIGDVAALLREPEHRVSQAIRAALGFPNFNRWINHHRIARARRLLADPAEARTILDIAFACGFASLGPFNRAFRDEVGVTPRAYRTASKASSGPI